MQVASFFNFNFLLNRIFILFSRRDNSSSRINTLDPLWLWQCLPPRNVHCPAIESLYRHNLLLLPPTSSSNEHATGFPVFKSSGDCQREKSLEDVGVFHGGDLGQRWELRQRNTRKIQEKYNLYYKRNTGEIQETSKLNV